MEKEANCLFTIEKTPAVSVLWFYDVLYKFCHRDIQFFFSIDHTAHCQRDNFCMSNPAVSVLWFYDVLYKFCHRDIQLFNSLFR